MTSELHPSSHKFSRGSQVTVTLNTGERVSGYVHGVDSDVRMLMLSERLTSPASSACFQLLNLDALTSVHVSNPITKQKLPMPVSTKQSTPQIEQWKAAMASIPDGVPEQGRKVFELLCRQMQCSWSRYNIIVQDDVMITPPYTPESCKGSKPQALEYVKKVLATVWVKLDE